MKAIFTERIDELSYCIDVTIGRKTYLRVMNCVLYKDEHRILIGDIAFENAKKHINKGYGTEMMKMLLAFALRSGYGVITGQLMGVDFDHRERQIHFYKKFGFLIEPSDDERDMTILLTL